jgi:hypothetical protein
MRLMILLALSLGFTAPAAAQIGSPMTEFLFVDRSGSAPSTPDGRARLTAEVTRACGARGGEAMTGAFLERDLTGDHRSDLVVDHSRIRCADGSRSALCALAGCTFVVFVHDGARLASTVEEIGVGLRLADDRSIRWHGFGGEFHMIRWNGSRFE